MLVRDLPKDAQFVSDSQEVAAVDYHTGNQPGDFDSYFVQIGDGDYAAVWGMYGTVPHLTKKVYKVI